MPKLLQFRDPDVPEHIRLQILSFVRIEWPGGFSGPNQCRDWISKEEDHAVRFVLVEGGVLVSHAAVLWKFLEQSGESFKVFGLSGVFTYPSLRRQGFARQVVEAGTGLIRGSDGDIAMLWCNPMLKNFYGDYGWIPMAGAVTVMGPKDYPRRNEDLLMMMFLSMKAENRRSSFERGPIYFGLDTW